MNGYFTIPALWSVLFTSAVGSVRSNVFQDDSLNAFLASLVVFDDPCHCDLKMDSFHFGVHPNAALDATNLYPVIAPFLQRDGSVSLSQIQAILDVFTSPPSSRGANVTSANSPRCHIFHSPEQAMQVFGDYDQVQRQSILKTPKCDLKYNDANGQVSAYVPTSTRTIPDLYYLLQPIIASPRDRYFLRDWKCVRSLRGEMLVYDLQTEDRSKSISMRVVTDKVRNLPRYCTFQTTNDSEQMLGIFDYEYLPTVRLSRTVKIVLKNGQIQVAKLNTVSGFEIGARREQFRIRIRPGVRLFDFRIQNAIPYKGKNVNSWPSEVVELLEFDKNASPWSVNSRLAPGTKSQNADEQTFAWIPVLGGVFLAIGLVGVVRRKRVIRPFVR